MLPRNMLDGESVRFNRRSYFCGGSRRKDAPRTVSYAVTIPVNLANPCHCPPMKQHLAISAIGPDRIGLVHELSQKIADCGGNISESRMTALGSDFAILMLVSGNWHAVARIETELKKFAETAGITLQISRTNERPVHEDRVPYSVDVVCLDQSGIVSALSGFFAARGIDVSEMNTRSYAAPHTGAPMFGVYMIVNVPASIHLGAMREEFMDLCDNLNLDAILEPVKS